MHEIDRTIKSGLLAPQLNLKIKTQDDTFPVSSFRIKNPGTSAEAMMRFSFGRCVKTDRKRLNIMKLSYEIPTDHRRRVLLPMALSREES